MPRVLLIEDDINIGVPLKKDLEFEQHTVDLAEDGEHAWTFLKTAVYDLIILDLLLPKVDGMTLCHRIRKEGMTVPILMLTARDTKGDKVAGLDAGADDYIVKPFDLDELHARIRCLLRRADASRDPVLRHRSISLDPARKQVSVNDEIVELTPREYQLLEHFLRHPGRTFSRADLVSHLWDWNEMPESDVVKTHVKTMRRKLREAGADDPIETVHGFGYCLSKHV